MTALLAATNLLIAVGLQESGGDAYAINEAEGAYGIYQIRELALEDLRQAYGVQLDLRDFLGNVPLSQWAFWGYGRLYGAITSEEYCRIWNGGPRGALKKGTIRYWESVREIMAKLGRGA